jgi:hypothetical protein
MRIGEKGKGTEREARGKMGKGEGEAVGKINRRHGLIRPLTENRL